MEYFALIIAIIAFVLAVSVLGQVRSMERESREHPLDQLARQDHTIQQLTKRVFALEEMLRQVPAAPERPIKQTLEPEPASQAVGGQAEAVTPPEPILAEPELRQADVPHSPPAFIQAAGPTLAERIQHALGGDEWEALVGGSLLNKLGAVILVIGIALFLGYSFTQMGPPGRAALSFVISLSLLATGVLVERKPRYQAFSRGLIGAGWAALYATSYSVWALDAARVISNPFPGSLLMLIVAAGMIAHSLSI